MDGLTPHILVVEDDAALLESIRDLLNFTGYRVSTALNGQEALSLLDRLTFAPDLIVTDVYMPVLDGPGLLAAVRSRSDRATIPFIFLTARSQKEEIREAKLLGVDDYVIKPFEFEDLRVAIHSCLERRRLLIQRTEDRIEALRNDILTIIHHEFRTPLSFIVAYAELMADSPDFRHSETLQICVNGIVSGTERLSRTLESFLLLAELESGYTQQSFLHRRIRFRDYDALIERVVASLQPLAGRCHARIERFIEPDMPAIMAEPGYLEIAVRHLVENSLKFARPDSGAKVGITVMRDNQAVAFIIEDNGIGIDPLEIPSLFDLFYQSRRDVHEQQGLGAGLPISQRIARIHGGTLELSSEPDIGTSAAIRIPFIGSDSV